MFLKEITLFYGYPTEKTGKNFETAVCGRLKHAAAKKSVAAGKFIRERNRDPVPVAKAKPASKTKKPVAKAKPVTRKETASTYRIGSCCPFKTLFF
jgi:hypothetical protein